MSSNNHGLIKTLSILPGCAEHEHADWLIGPCGVTRDSDIYERANWTALSRALDALDPEGLDHEDHRFGHWACGWVEEMATRPGSQCHAEANAIAKALTEDPIVSDDVLSEIEMEDEAEAWEAYARRDFCRAVGEILDVLDKGHEHDYDPDDDSAYDLWHAGCGALGLYVEHSSNGPSFPLAAWSAAARSSLQARLSEMAPKFRTV